ncbi:MAG TPA: response regulator [Rhodopila sp.]|uniref:response regulator n=1 Tax=Rhodopila sp. TaxID=2480087 RepID=UPI002BFB0FB4|nr:response regulator [Rhodopila sp.]HVY16157.1 response regulator [Rhodopila sp.]
MKLSTRLILLILGCLLPILTAQVYSQTNLYAERRQQLGALVLRQVELANADVNSIVDGVHQLGVLAVQVPGIGQTSEDCDRKLDQLRSGLPRYRFLALADPVTQTITCVSEEPGMDLLSTRPQVPSWMLELIGHEGTSTGHAVFARETSEGVLPIAVAMPSPSGGVLRTVLVAGLSIRWLADHLKSADTQQSGATAGSELYVTDSDGMVIGHAGASAQPPPTRLPAWLGPVIAHGTEGVTTLEDPKGRSYIVGYMPLAAQSYGLAIVEALQLPKATADLDQANYQDLMVIGGAACVALLLAWLAGRRFIVKPTDALLRAARRWREGDLSARAELDDSGSEFSALAHSFNAMAAGLEAREIERAAQAHLLEAQVAERTRELSESNNRLQVEIAGREKTEAALHQAQKLQAVGQLAGGIAHDFNNMLATVLGNIELMERRLAQAAKNWTEGDTERLQKLIERATGAVQRGGQLTSRLLAFSRRQRLAARPTDINALLQELVTLATSTLGRRVQVVSELADDLWPAMVDPSQVEAGILNLCLNARDAMPEGGTLTLTTDNACVGRDSEIARSERDLAPGDYIRIRISDTGSGMTSEVKARAFDPFFTTKGPGAGSGLGLSQVYGMARQSGGSVSIDSTPGEGTVVTLLLPRATEVEAVNPVAAAPVAGRATGRPKELVLVVDDDHAVRQVTVEMARDLGCEVVQAQDGEQALSILAKLPTPPHFLLLDYLMPGMNGLQLAQAIRDRNITAPIALVTGYAELSEVDLSTSCLSALLRKPFTIRELESVLNQLRTMPSDAAVLEHGLIGQ